MCEMTLNEEFYLQPSITCLLDVPLSGKQSPVLAATSSKYNEASNSCINPAECRDLARTVSSSSVCLHLETVSGLVCGMCMQSPLS